MVWEKTLESLLDFKKIRPVNLKEISPEYSFEGLILKLKLQYFGHLIEELTDLNNLDAGKDCRLEEKVGEEDEMVGWNHQLNGHEFKQAPGA